MNSIKVIYKYRLLIIVLLFFISNNSKSQVSIKEFSKDLETYDFSDPNPIPISKDDVVKCLNDIKAGNL